MYKQDDKILLNKAWKTKLNQDAFLGPNNIIMAVLGPLTSQTLFIRHI